MKKIDELKQLCYEHDRLIRLKDKIKHAKEKDNWIRIQTPDNSEGEPINYDGDFIVDSILNSINTRIKKIEKITGSEEK